MYLAIRTASLVSGDTVVKNDRRIVGIELSADIPSYVTSLNEYVYTDLSTVPDMTSYVNDIINNLDTASITVEPKGTVAIAPSKVALGGDKTDRCIDDSSWDNRVPQAWMRALCTTNFVNL